MFHSLAVFSLIVSSIIIFDLLWMNEILLEDLDNKLQNQSQNIFVLDRTDLVFELLNQIRSHQFLLMLNLYQLTNQLEEYDCNP